MPRIPYNTLKHTKVRYKGTQHVTARGKLFVVVDFTAQQFEAMEPTSFTAIHPIDDYDFIDFNPNDPKILIVRKRDLQMVN